MPSPLPVLTTALFCLALPLAPLAAQEKGSKDLKNVLQAAWQGQRWAEAEDVLVKLVTADKKDGKSWYQLGYALHAQKKYDRALTAHIKAASFAGNPQAQQLGTYNAACVYAIQGKKDLAFEWLEKSLAAGFARAAHLQTDADMDNLRDDARFAGIIARMKKAQVATPMRAFSGTTARENSRVAYFGRGGSGGQFAVDWGTTRWSDKFVEILEQERYFNQRWRLGSNSWTTLDTNIPLTIGGTKIEPGLYYLTVTHRGDAKFVMTLLDPIDVRKRRLDAYVANQTKGGIEVGLKYHATEDVAKKLSITVAVEREKNTVGSLTVRFGPHKLTAPLQAHLAKY